MDYVQSNATSNPTQQSPPAAPAGVTWPAGWCGPGATLQAAAGGGSLQPAVQCFSAVGSRAAVTLGRLFSYVALTMSIIRQ